MSNKPSHPQHFEIDWYHDLVINSPDSFIVVNRQGTILFLNHDSETLTGGSFKGTPLHEYFMPEFKEMVSAKIEQVFETGQNNHYELASEYWGLPRRYYMTNLAPIKRDGEVTAVVLYIREITELKNTQNDLMDLNNQLEQRVNERTKELQENIANRELHQQILYNIMAAANEKVELDELLPTMLDLIFSAINCGVSVIQLVDGGQFTRSIFDPDPLPDYYSPALEQSRKIAQSAGNSFGNQKHLFFEGSDDINSLIAPIRSRGNTIGVISLIGECLQSSDSELIRLTTSLADEIGLAVENARQRRQSEETLILQERQRLARDLHDSVSQSLYGLVLSADIGKKLLRIKEYKTLASTLTDIESFALQSLREMRLMLFELRPLSFEFEGLVGALQLRLKTVEERAGIQFELVVDGEDLIPSPLDLELYRIATEALNNSLKHSNGTRVNVMLQVNKETRECLLEVSDNGSGFDTGSRRSGGIGLESMHERTARMGGRLQIESNHQNGTMVRFTCSLDQNLHESAGKDERIDQSTGSG